MLTGSHAGEVAALFTALFWTITALVFESASRRIGSLAVNLLRLVIAFFFLGGYTLITRGYFFPVDASFHNWFWLSISGLIGFVIGDLALFQAFVLVGARISLLVMSLVPLFAGFISWVFLGETISFINMGGMGLTMAGIALAVLGRKRDNGKLERISFSYSLNGLLLALAGAIGQAAGLVMSKYGMGSFDAFASSQIRVLFGILGFSALFFILKKWKRVFNGMRDMKALKLLSVGAFFGPFLGVSFSLLAVQLTNTGVASAIMSTAPVIIIPPAVILFREKLKGKEVLGAILAVAGVAIFFLAD